jgi:hypothetical protein
MAVELLENPGATLALPGHYPRTDLAREMGARFSEGQKQKFYRSPWVIDPIRIVAPNGFVVNARTIDASMLETADLIFPKERLKVHFLTSRKPLEAAKTVPAEPDWKVLAINLRYYATLWWQTCDEDKEQRIAEARAAKSLMARWLGEQDTGRGFLYHPEFQRRKELLADLVRRQKEHEAEQLAREARQRNERVAASKAADAYWTIPKNNEAELGTALFFKPARPAEVANLTRWLATNLGLVRATNLSQWGFAGAAGTIVPETARRYLDSDAAWTPIPPEFIEKFEPHGNGVHAARPKPVDQLSQPDQIMIPNLGLCVRCQSAVDEVIFGSGLFRGRRGRRCSANSAHPTTIL